MIVNVADSFNETRTVNETDQESIFFSQKSWIKQFLFKVILLSEKK